VARPFREESVAAEQQTIVRYRRNGEAGYGLIRDGAVYAAVGDVFAGATAGALVGGVDEVELLAPVEPSKIVAVGLNYLDHITEDAAGFTKPETPILFLKPPSSLAGHNADLVLPRGAEQVDGEAELAIVIGRPARYVRREDAYDSILGFACSNDVSARDYQFKDNQWMRAKGFDTFCPVGPIVTGLRADDLAIESRLNGEVKQSSRTSSLLFDVPTLVAFVSRVMTLLPGDLIMTGTPAHPPRVVAGDVIEIEIEGIGTLRNRCVAEDLPKGIAARAIDDVEA
jgi:2-keto-4-pentenoate hydratase/2-oxohepta-3-ene-1,7-dioic acid hydratase in catechol pathway